MSLLPRPSSPPILVPLRSAPASLENACRFELACIARTIVRAGLGELLPMALLTAPRASDVVTTGRQQ
ncbi:hypothetical protein LRS73_05320 [Methylobacterium currus]|uniref:hypothetical protein n=1 Tax=Methylobacterium currus TaxID=2051553 RepID=UPI001E584B70|nr:hypothetical protein [Methylobacterium currus]UHC17315.1 hypothetical protein LRS73_05320 [Methylobacterium currus]